MKTLYVHVPFCRSKCFYCSFVVSVSRLKNARAYLDALKKEALQYKNEIVRHVYVGGGTPTIMGCEDLKYLFDIIKGNFRIDRSAEWTVEANPENLTDKKLGLIKKEGINRISLGAQSFNDKYLKYLGRQHDVKVAGEAYQRIRSAGFRNVNIDLMFAFPGQTIDELKKDIDEVARLESEHLSLYALTIEKPSRFFAQSMQLEDSEYQAQQYVTAYEVLECSGFKQYEISNFAKESKESQHNLNYWQGGEYIGLGVGAHSYIKGTRSWNVSRLREYISLVEQGGYAKEGNEILSPYEQMRDVILFGLRMNRGVDVHEAESRFGCPLKEDQQKRIAQFIDNGFLLKEGGRLKASQRGMLVLDELCAQLV